MVVEFLMKMCNLLFNRWQTAVDFRTDLNTFIVLYFCNFYCKFTFYRTSIESSDFVAHYY